MFNILHSLSHGQGSVGVSLKDNIGDNRKNIMLAVGDVSSAQILESALNNELALALSIQTNLPFGMEQNPVTTFELIISDIQCKLQSSAHSRQYYFPGLVYDLENMPARLEITVTDCRLFDKSTNNSLQFFPENS